MTLAVGELAVLYESERAAAARFDLPAPLAALYAGSIGFPRRCLFANFVASIDGVVALAVPGESGHVVSQESKADAFVMSLLRACADAVMVGAGTFRKAGASAWDAAGVYPAGAALFEETRKRLGLRPKPTLILVTGSGQIDTGDPALRDAIVITTPGGAEVLRGRLPPEAEVLACLGESPSATWVDTMERLHARGLSRVLSEGGPTLFAELAAARVIDELFVTSSPVLYGRLPGDRRKTLVDGLDLGGERMELLSVRRHRSHLFLRYALSPAGARASGSSLTVH